MGKKFTQYMTPYKILIFKSMSTEAKKYLVTAVCAGIATSDKSPNLCVQKENGAEFSRLTNISAEGEESIHGERMRCIIVIQSHL